MSPQKLTKKPYIFAALLVIAVVMGMGMVRLGFWQLDRADQKQIILDQLQQRAESKSKTLNELLVDLSHDVEAKNWAQRARFQPVTLTGEYLPEQSILIDNQVFNKQGGYQLITPFKISSVDHLSDSERLMMVSRGWLPAGATREDLPHFTTPSGQITISGRLNTPPAQPPLWKEGYPVNDGLVWQYLAIEQFAEQLRADIYPLVVELAPENPGSADLVVRWQTIDDHWVAKHKGYAFQWFSMALAFFIACIVLLLKTLRR